HVVVERRQRSVPGIAQHLVQAAFLSLAGKQGNAERLRVADVLRHFRQHGDTARNVEAADADRQSGGKEWTGEIDCTWKLVGLDADKTDQRLATEVADVSDDP